MKHGLRVSWSRTLNLCLSFGATSLESKPGWEHQNTLSPESLSFHFWEIMPEIFEVRTLKTLGLNICTSRRHSVHSWFQTNVFRYSFLDFSKVRLAKIWSQTITIDLVWMKSNFSWLTWNWYSLFLCLTLTEISVFSLTWIKPQSVTFFGINLSLKLKIFNISVVQTWISKHCHVWCSYQDKYLFTNSSKTHGTNRLKRWTWLYLPLSVY